MKMELKPEEMLLAQVRAYLMLAKSLKSYYYLTRAIKTLELYNESARNRTAILAA